jgi:hypothetical protein
MSQENIFQKSLFETFVAVIEGRDDPLMLGRCKIRIFGYHTEDKTELPTEDLPWAFPIQPITSAGNSGVGHTPLGVVPGSWVVGYFMDSRDKQMPVFFGVIGSFQSPTYVEPNTTPPTPADATYGAESKQGVLVDSGGDPVRTDAISSPSGWELGQTSEKYESGGRGPGVINNYKTLNDPGGASYGCYQLASFLPKKMPNGQSRKDAKKTQLTEFITQSRFSSLFDGLTPGTDAFDLVWKKVAADNPAAFKEDQHNFIKQNNYVVMLSKLKREGCDLSQYSAAVQDMIWSTSVQFGPNKLSVFLNPLKDRTQLTDKDVVNLVMDYKLANIGTYFASSSESIRQGIQKRYASEKTELLKLCDGEVKARNVDEAATTYGGTFDASKDAANKTYVSKRNTGFIDPLGEYPFATYAGEQDTNKLARGVVLDSAAEYKSGDRAFGLPLPNGGSFDQPSNPFAAQYPYNKVFESETGHVMEFDDTPGCERINLWHNKGTFLEMDAAGNQVNRIIGSSYQIIDNNGYIHIQGKANVSVSGECNVFIGADANIEVHGNTNLHCFNDIAMNAEGTINIAAGEAISLRAPVIYHEADDAINLKVNDGEMNLTAKNVVSIKSESASILADAPSGIRLEEGGSVTADYSDAGLPFEGREYVSEVVIEDLFPPSRSDSEYLKVEAPNDQYTTEQAFADLEAMGTISKSDTKDTGVTLPDNSSPISDVKTEGSTSVVNTDYIKGLSNFPTSFQLSQNFTLGDLSAYAPAMPTKVVAQFGLTEGEIVANLQLLAVYVLEPIKKRYPNMFVTSGFRTYSKGSQHCSGQAADCQFKGANKADYIAIIKDIEKLVPYDQIIAEYRNTGSGLPWLHISYSSKINRKMQLTYYNNKAYSNTLVNVA